MRSGAWTNLIGSPDSDSLCNHHILPQCFNEQLGTIWSATLDLFLLYSCCSSAQCVLKWTAGLISFSADLLSTKINKIKKHTKSRTHQRIRDPSYDWRCRGRSQDYPGTRAGLHPSTRLQQWFPNLSFISVKVKTSRLLQDNNSIQCHCFTE